MKKQILIRLSLMLLFITIAAAVLYGLFAFFVYMVYLANAMLFGVEYAAKVALQHHVPAIGTVAIFICLIVVIAALYFLSEEQKKESNKEKESSKQKEEVSPSILVSSTEDFSNLTFSKEIEDKINLLQEKDTQVICYGFSQSDRRALAEVCASKMKMQFVYIDDFTIKKFKSVENVFASSKGPYVIFADSDNLNSLKTFSQYINKKLPKGSKLILGTSNLVKLDKSFVKNFKVVEADLSRGNFYEKILEVCGKELNDLFDTTEMSTLYKDVLEKVSISELDSICKKVMIEVLKKHILQETVEFFQVRKLFEQEMINSECKSIVKNRNSENLDDIVLSEGVHKQIDKILAPPSKRVKELGLNIDNGCILYGPPGTGKTKIARIIANKRTVPFLSTVASDFFGKYAHQSPDNIGEFFNKIDKENGCVVLIDEIDAIGRKRSEKNSANNDEHVMAIEKFFYCMDQLKRCKSYDKIVIIGTTNRLDCLDDAFSRRFAHKIKFDLPDLKSRKKLLLMYSKELILHLQEAFDWNKITEIYIKIGEKTDGFSGSDLENLCNSIKWNFCMDEKHTTIIDGKYTTITKEKPITIQAIEDNFNDEIERRNKQRKCLSPQQHLKVNSVSELASAIRDEIASLL